MPQLVLDLHHTEADAARSLRADVLAGLASTPKWLPPKWFYDARGSALFEEITRLPEYYPTRAEREVLAREADEIARVTGAETLVELGSGSSEKTRLLLDALHRQGLLKRFVPLDVSTSALAMAASSIASEYTDVEVHGVVGDFTAHLDAIPAVPNRMIAFLGGTIGNLEPQERAVFLRSVREALEPGEWLLLGADLVKDPGVLVPAYDDSAGVTAEFNRNVLHVLNRELGADFDVEEFEHVARWNSEAERIEMWLRARRAMTVTVAELGLHLSFAEGEELRTETSAKFRRQGLADELHAAGLALRRFWTDRAGRFSVALAQVTATTSG